MLLRVFAARRLLGMPLSPKWWFSTTVQAVGEKVWDSKRAAKSAKKDGGTWTGSPVPGFGLSLQIYYDRMAMNYEYTYLEDRWIEKNFKGFGRSSQMSSRTLLLQPWAHLVFYPWWGRRMWRLGHSELSELKKKGIWLVDACWCFVIDPWFFQASLLGSRNCFRNTIFAEAVLRLEVLVFFSFWTSKRSNLLARRCGMTMYDSTPFW